MRNKDRNEMKNFLIACSICGVLYYFRKYLTSDVSNHKYYGFVITVPNTNNTNVYYIVANNLEEAKVMFRKDTYFNKGDLIDILHSNDLNSVVRKYEYKYSSVVEATDPG